MRDLYHNIKPNVSFDPAAHTASVTGTGVDLAGFESAIASVQFGAITDGTHTPKLQDSPDNSTFTDVDASLVQGAFTAALTGAGNGGSAVQTVGYIGQQRYLRVFVTAAGTTSGGIYGATITEGHPRHAPVTITQAP